MKFLANWRARKSADDAESVYISERHGVRSLHIGSDTVQSSMRLAKPNDLELSYTRSMMGFLLFAPPPSEVLMIGLGGGSLAKFVYHQLPGARTRAVEVNPRVVAIARQYFQVPEDGERFEIVTTDGAEYVEREDVGADVVLLDGYEGDSHVEALATPAFYTACRMRLRPGGVMAVNLWGRDKLFYTLVKRIEDAFPGGLLCLPAERPGNVVVFGFEHRRRILSWETLVARALELEVQYGLEFPKFVESLKKMNPHDTDYLYP
jgi:spermidine synthase